MPSSMATEARPVRMPERSRRTDSTEPCMRCLASATSCLCVLIDSLLDQRAQLLAAHQLAQVPLAPQVVDDDRQPVVHAERDGRGVHDLQALLQDVEVA